MVSAWRKIKFYTFFIYFRGIVADSKVDYEYEETINKMMALIKSVEDAERNL